MEKFTQTCFASLRDFPSLDYFLFINIKVSFLDAFVKFVAKPKGDAEKIACG